MTDARGVMVCANPFSGSGPNRRRVEGLAGALVAKGFEPRLVWDLEERRGLLADAQLHRWCRCVVVAGGDGSIGAVVNELGEAGALRAGAGGQGVALATLPMGNENLFAGHLGFTGDVEALVLAIERGRTRRIDLGRVGGRLFTLMVGVGFDAEVVHRMDRWRSAGRGQHRGRGLKRVSRRSYVPRLVSSLWGYGYPQLTVEVDGRELVGAHLFVFNLPVYGGGLEIAPLGCVGDDGLLDWVLFERPGMGSLLGYGWSVIRGRHLDRRDVHHGRSAQLRVSSSVPAPIQADGDPAGRSASEIISVAEAGLELLIEPFE